MEHWLELFAGQDIAELPQLVVEHEQRCHNQFVYVCLSLALLVSFTAHAQDLIEKAARQIDQGDRAGAERIVTDHVASHPRSARGHYLLGFIHFRTGRIQEAADSLQESARLAPNDHRTWRLLGMARSANGDFDGALEPFEKACRLSRADPDTCYYLGRNYYVLSRFKKSVVIFSQVLEGLPEDWRAHRGLGLSLEALAKHEDAEEHLRKSVRFSAGGAPPDLDPRIDLGAFCYRRGRTGEAIQVLESALKDHPAVARAHFELARCLAQIQQNERAVQHLETALHGEPENWPAHQLLGKLYMRLGKVEQGRRRLEVARQGIVADTYGSRTVR